MPHQPILRKGNGRIYPAVQDGLLEYTVATRVYDMLVWCTGDPAYQEEVLLHQRYTNWLGENAVGYSRYRY